MMPVLRECERFYYDEAAAVRPERFAAKYLRHYEGKFAGQPFTFLPWQLDVTRALFGWKRRDDGRRRFKECYMLTAKGSGKTPWMSAIGLYLLLMDGEQGAHVISAATDFAQANLTLEAGKKYVAADPDLDRRCRVMQFSIKAPRTNGQWSVISGTAEGKHGFRPTALLMDEAHEWPNGKLYNNLTTNVTKRQQPLVIVATNAGEGEHSFWYQLHKRAVKAMDGGGDGTLLPVIYEAPDDLAWDSEAAAAAANPSLGHIYGFDALAPEVEKARESDEALARYCRLFLSRRQKTGDGAWLDIARWNAAVEKWAEPPADAPLYVGVDLAQSDDLCAVAYVYVTPGRMHVRAHFYLPRSTAERYQLQHAVPYLSEWEATGRITLVDEPTISPKVRQRIAADIVAAGKGRTVKAVGYDRYKADETVAALEAAGLTCVPIAQGYSVSPGAHELERRIKEDGTIVIEPNPVLAFCAANAEAKCDDRGNLWVSKPAAKGKFAGTRWKKVDGITALVTALVEARKHAFPAVKKEFKGGVWVL